MNQCFVGEFVEYNLVRGIDIDCTEGHQRHLIESSPFNGPVHIHTLHILLEIGIDCSTSHLGTGSCSVDGEPIKHFVCGIVYDGMRGDHTVIRNNMLSLQIIFNLR